MIPLDRLLIADIVWSLFWGTFLHFALDWCQFKTRLWFALFPGVMFALMVLHSLD